MSFWPHSIKGQPMTVQVKSGQGTVSFEIVMLKCMANDGMALPFSHLRQSNLWKFGKEIHFRWKSDVWTCINVIIHG